MKKEEIILANIRDAIEFCFDSLFWIDKGRLDLALDDLGLHVTYKIEKIEEVLGSRLSSARACITLAINRIRDGKLDEAKLNIRDAVVFIAIEPFMKMWKL